jgi:hypothetical protein
MISKEKFRELVESTGRRLNMSQEEIAIDLGYGKNYISESLTPTGTLSKKLIDKFRIKYGLENPKTTDFGQRLELGDFAPTIKDYFMEVRGERDFLRQVLSSSLADICTNLSELIKTREDDPANKGQRSGPKKKVNPNASGHSDDAIPAFRNTQVVRSRRTGPGTRNGKNI